MVASGRTETYVLSWLVSFRLCIYLNLLHLAMIELYDAIVQGNIPQAFDLIYRHFPSLAAQDPNAPPTPEPRVIEHNSSIDPSHLRYILFKLRCQQFIEIIRSSDSVQAIEFAKMYLRPQHKDHQHLRDEVSVLIAYSSPEESNYRHLLSQERRQELADQVNTVVLGKSIVCIIIKASVILITPCFPATKPYPILNAKQLWRRFKSRSLLSKRNSVASM